ncbi:MAG: cupin domain-containing protein [Bdellovibrionaceae bacterium]|nr:cupin domain-containing protein [Pseudobdellovibrionaceae bacterium]NUM59849.1 cupin domain-containing protein [Pseudobdellovibrionaceae bacterium]
MKCVVNLHSDSNLNFEIEEHGKYSSQSAQIAKNWETTKLGFHVEILNPKSFSCPYHFHHQEEELFIVLSGSAMVRQDDQYYEVTDGDLVIFKTGVAHQFYNHTNEPFKFFALSNKDPNEICEYPDSNKKWVRKEQKLYQNGVKVVDYWKDEENPDQKWAGFNKKT